MKTPARVQAEALVALLLDDFHLPVKLRDPNGNIVDGDFNGYWDMRPMGGKLEMSIGYPKESGMSHGRLNPGWELLTRVPSYEEWLTLKQSSGQTSHSSMFRQLKQQQSQEPPAEPPV